MKAAIVAQVQAAAEFSYEELTELANLWIGPTVKRLVTDGSEELGGHDAAGPRAGGEARGCGARQARRERGRPLSEVPTF